MSKQSKYQSWFPQKMQLDRRTGVASYGQREVWWCQLGVNIGYEIYGHGQAFTRPVLVLQKYSRFTFLAAPLSTAAPKTQLHVPVTIAGRQGIVRLDQLRTLDARRLVGKRLAKMSPLAFANIQQTVRRQFE